jgi:hypothetical protein
MVTFTFKISFLFTYYMLNNGRHELEWKCQKLCEPFFSLYKILLKDLLLLNVIHNESPKIPYDAVVECMNNVCRNTVY